MPLGKRTDFGDARFAGLEVGFTPDIESAVESAVLCGFDFVVAPLAAPTRRPTPPSLAPDGTLTPPFLPSHVMHTMDSAHLSNQVVGKVSAWIDTDAADPHLAALSRQALQEELAWATHLTVQACMLPPPPSPESAATYARLVNHALVAGVATMPLWVQLPLCYPESARSMSLDVGGGDSSNNSAAAKFEKKKDPRTSDPWEAWNEIRFATYHSVRVGVALLVGPDLPSEADIERWWGEPVKALILQTDAFLTNKRGYPALSKRHQQLVGRAFELGVQVVLSGECKHEVPAPPPPPPGEAPAAQLAQLNTTISSSNSNEVGPSKMPVAADQHGLEIIPSDIHPMRVYWEYLSFLFRKQAASSPYADLEAPYRDYLQAPLQPLQDDLESQTYEVFERDGIKYTTYGEAVRRALLDLVPDAEAATRVTVLMVVGAGRGPLVSASLQAATAAGRRLKVYAVEKNPNAVVHLHTRAANEGWTNVSIVHADMRDWRAPEQADILVSELLGSFSDNELSPECLDGAQRFLKPSGISIPESYTSYLQPVTTHKLWTAVHAYNDLEHFETPFVVKFHRVTPLAAPLPVFTFTHPNRASIIDNNRSIKLKFKCVPPGGTVCHGFAGYFDTKLYKDVTLSIHPETHTPNMFSWFPIYFPVRQPFYVAPGSEIEAAMWRVGTRHKVWYEWSVQTPSPSPVHNPNGRSYYVGL